ncbi:DNA alkylation repair protein [Candidatus Poribacteria bacterium]
MQYEEILGRIEALSNPEAAKGMARYGISTQSVNYGVSIPNLRKIAKEAGRDHSLAQQLWAMDSRETRILAAMIDDPEVVSEKQVDEWVEDLDNWEVCDQCCMNLFEKTEFAYQKCFQWSFREEEFVKRAGFVLMARLAVSDKKASDEQFEQFFPTIEREADDNRNYVKKGINWALRQIGKRNLSLNEKAIKVAGGIQKMDSKSARWIAADALRELTSEAVQERLRRHL